LHGGLTPVGPACKHYRSGRYSTYLPERLRARYEQAEDDAELLSLRSEVALVDARLADLLSRVETGESGQRWLSLRKAHRASKRSRLSGDVPAMTQTLAEIELVIERATDDHAAWGEIAALLEQRRKLTESEQKRLVTLQQMLSSEQAMAMIHRLIDIITRHVPDRQVLSAIVVEISALAERSNGLPASEESPDV
jgi:hypothetical protein